MRHSKENPQLEVKMKKNLAKIILLLFLVAGFSVNSMAEPPADIDKPPTKTQRDRVRKRIETLRMWKLTKALDLDEKTSAQLFPVLNRYDRKRAEVEDALSDNIRELRASLNNGNESQMKGTLDRLEQEHREFQRINAEERTELTRILTIDQQARFVIFLQEFQSEMRRMAAEAYERRMGKR